MEKLKRVSLGWLWMRVNLLSITDQGYHQARFCILCANDGIKSAFAGCHAYPYLCRAPSRNDGAHTPSGQGSDACARDLRVFAGLDAADTHCTDAVAIHQHRHTAFKQTAQARRTQKGHAALVDDVFVDLGLAAAERSRVWALAGAIWADTAGAPSRRCSHSRWPPSSTMAMVTAH